MKAAFLIKFGHADEAFEIRETGRPSPGGSQVLIKVQAFGLNFADIMARLGLYRDTPELPCILGYDVVGTVEEAGAEVQGLQVGDRVIALTRFGGYAEFALAERSVVHKVPDSFSFGIATALATQGCTAYFLAHDMAHLQREDRVLIHAAAGGVGTMLVQMARQTGCEIFATCGSPEKAHFLKDLGVDHVINYRKDDFAKVIKKKSLDIIFDPIGGRSVAKGFSLLGAGGRIISFGISSMNQTRSIFGKLNVLRQFGLYHPVQFLSASRGMIGVNMLKLGDERPAKLIRIMNEVIRLTEDGKLKPQVGGQFEIGQLAEAHSFLESRKSIGKIVVKW